MSLLHCGGKNFGVVEGEGWEVFEGVPFYGGGVVGSFWILGVLVRVGEIGERDGVAPGVAAGATIEAGLLEGESGDVGFFFQFARDSVVGVFVLVNKAAGEGPLAGEGLVLSLDEQHVGRSILGSKDDGVDGDGRTWIIVGEGHALRVRSVLS